MTYTALRDQGVKPIAKIITEKGKKWEVKQCLLKPVTCEPELIVVIFVCVSKQYMLCLWDEALLFIDTLTE